MMNSYLKYKRIFLASILPCIFIIAYVMSTRLCVIPLLPDMSLESHDKKKEDPFSVMIRETGSYDDIKKISSTVMPPEEFDKLLKTPFFSKPFVQYRFGMRLENNEPNEVFNFYENWLLRNGWIKIRGKSFLESVLAESETGVYEKNGIMFRLHRYGSRIAQLTPEDMANGAQTINDVAFEFIGASVHIVNIGKKRWVLLSR